MTYSRFVAYNVSGGILWVAIFVFAGYFFGEAEIVKKNFSLVIIAIVLISVLPGVIEYIRHRRASRQASA
jgi:membrane-associated protein